jgi:hypothetical protein
MKTLPCVLLGVLPAAIFAADPTPIPRSTASGLPRDGQFAFSLLPKSFQRNPELEMTVNTEFTDYGRLLRPATPENPVYYAAVAVGYKQFGGPMGEHPPPAADLERAMKRALAVNGYLPVENPGQAPALVVVYYWGSHINLDPETRRDFPDLAAKNKLERAILVGGKKYANAEARVLEWGETLLDHERKQEFLRGQISNDIYYVVASAYDYASVAKGPKKLAWRTSMTVNTGGVSMSETLAPLIAMAAPFFGHETTEPQIDIRRSNRSGRVEVGTPTVVSEKK